MSARQESRRSLVVSGDHPLIGVIDQENDNEVVRYFTDEKRADAASGQASIQRALNLAGAWQHLMPWEEAEADLDRIRHQSQPACNKTIRQGATAVGTSGFGT